MLPLRRHGGIRPGAGRKPKGPKPLVSHKARMQFDKPLPVHVTLRVGEKVWNLRSGRSYRRHGMQGLCIRIAKALNAMMRRSGRVFADHYHSRLLRSPTEVARAIRYVLNNHRHHHGERGVDRFSSAALDAAERAKVLSRPLGWLLRAGWRRAKWDLGRARI